MRRCKPSEDPSPLRPSSSSGADSPSRKHQDDPMDVDEDCPGHQGNNFFDIHGRNWENVNRESFRSESDFLPWLLGLNLEDYGNFNYIVETCRNLRRIAQEDGEILSVFHGRDDDMVKRFAFDCISAIHKNRFRLKDTLFVNSDDCNEPTFVLLEVVRNLVDNLDIAISLLKKEVYKLFREILQVGQGSIRLTGSSRPRSSIERVLVSIIKCPHSESERWSFVSEILSMSFLWTLVPSLKEDLVDHEFLIQCVHQISPHHLDVLPVDDLTRSPAFFCLLANVLEVAAIFVSRPDCSGDTVVEFSAAAIRLLPVFFARDKAIGKGPEPKKLHTLLERQILGAIDSCFLKDLINKLLSGFSVDSSCENDVIVGGICSLLEAIFINLPSEGTITAIANGTELIPILWRLIKWFEKDNKWTNFSKHSNYLPKNAPGWLIALFVFCPLYKSKLTVVDHEKFNSVKILPTDDLKLLIKILKQALLQLMWVDLDPLPDLTKPTTELLCVRQQPLDFFRHKVAVQASDLLAQLNEWNDILKFADPCYFSTSDGVSSDFISQAVDGNVKALNILKCAPLLVPFNDRVQIFNARRLDDAKEFQQKVPVYIRRNHLIEDGFDLFPESHLKKKIVITYMDAHGREEDGLDGGGLFKDFIDRFTQAVFAEGRLFKATEDSDNCYYPEPNSTTPEHLRKYYVLGKIIAKAMYSGIPIDIPFAVFFLRKLKNRNNYVKDMCSMDSTRYRSLLSLKEYTTESFSDLLYDFTVPAPTSAKPGETYELLKGGADLPVRKENFNEFIHLTADYALNFQIRQQTTYFQKGFEQLIPLDWIDMFNENELQLLITGPSGIDIADFKEHVIYHGYNKNDSVIVMFWDVLEELKVDMQKKFLRFVTGCSRVPVLGFGALKPEIGITRMEKPPDNLPKSQTCMNHLLLPPYISKEQLKSKLEYAIMADVGFEEE